VDIGKKMNIKPGFTVTILNEPDGVGLDVGDVRPIGIDEDPDAVVLFVRDRADLDLLAPPVVAAPQRDAVSWVACPKGGQLGTNVNRDSFWEWSRVHGIRPVRQVSIDDVWSALRFRPA
jgi:hypothetical protein